MNNNRGQALVEFIIILPIFLLLILALIDFGNIITKKYSLQNDLDTVSSLYQDKKYSNINSYITDKNIKISYTTKEDLLAINLRKEVKVMCPILNLIFGSTYEINVEKDIYKNE